MGLLLTFRCNARCAHCCFECHPGRREQMSPGQALDYIDQVSKIKAIQSITFTGGEVFTAYDLLRTAVEAAGAGGMAVRVVSNGFWAQTVQKARERLQPLVNGGLTTINLSCDPFHEQYVETAKVRNAVEASLEMGLDVVVTQVRPGGPQPGDEEKLLSALGLGKTSPVHILLNHINPAGRAVRHFDLDRLDLVDGDSEAGIRLHDVCPYVVRDPIITPAGDLCACCGTTVAMPTGFCETFVAGNLNSFTMAGILEEMELNPLYVGLMVEGPWYFYQRLRLEAPNLFPRNRFVNICDLCACVVCSRDARQMLINVLTEQEPRLLIKRMMLEAGRSQRF